MNYKDKTREELIEMIKFYKHDSLTGMKMRKDFDIEFSSKFFSGGHFYLTMFDVNGLHAINRAPDGGWAAGDALIRRVSERIKYYCAANSYRYGGDEFMIISDKKPDFTNASFPESCHEYVFSEDFLSPELMLKELDRLLTLVKEAYHKGNKDRRGEFIDRRH